MSCAVPRASCLNFRDAESPGVRGTGTEATRTRERVGVKGQAKGNQVGERERSKLEGTQS